MLEQRLRILYPVLTIVVTATLAACLGPAPISERKQASASELTAQYRLGPGDHVRVVVFNQPTMSGDFTIDGAGFIAMPLMGSVQCSEKTTRELEKLIVA